MPTSCKTKHCSPCTGDIMQQLESGPLKLGREVSRDGERSITITEERIPKTTPDGAILSAVILR